MENKQRTFTTVEEYLGSFPPAIQKMLFALRETIKSTAPGSEEKISYRMPAYYLKGTLVYFAAFKKHIGFYATPTANPVFQKELAHYKTGKGSIQFPIDEPLPLKLISRIVKFRVRENCEREIGKKNKSAKKVVVKSEKN